MNWGVFNTITASICRAAAAAREPPNLFGSIICICGLTGAHVAAAVAHIRAPVPDALRGRHRHHLPGLLLDRHPRSVTRLGVHPRSVSGLGLHPRRVGRRVRLLLLISHAWKRGGGGKSQISTSDKTKYTFTHQFAAKSFIQMSWVEHLCA